MTWMTENLQIFYFRSLFLGFVVTPSRVPGLADYDLWMLSTEERLRPLFVERLPVNIDEGLAVHAVDVEDSVQVVHFVLEDSSWPATGLPSDIFTLLVQTCKTKCSQEIINKIRYSLKFALTYISDKYFNNYRCWKQYFHNSGMHTRHFHRQVAWDCRREAWDALAALLKEHSPSIQDPQLRVNKDPQGLSWKAAGFSWCRWTLLQHLLWVFQGQNPEWHTNLWGAQSHTIKLTHNFHHSVDDFLDFSTMNSRRINSSRTWTQHWVSYLADMFVWRNGRGNDLVFHILKIGTCLYTAGVRAGAVCMQVGRHMWKTTEGHSTAGWSFGCTKS